MFCGRSRLVYQDVRRWRASRFAHTFPQVPIRNLGVPVDTVNGLWLDNGMSTNELQIGSVVKYSDIMNDSTFMVIGISNDQWNPLKLRNVETFEVEYTDGRQAGWRVVAA